MQTAEDTPPVQEELQAARLRIQRLEQSLAEVQRLATIGGLARLEARRCQNLLKRVANRHRIIHNQHGRRRRPLLDRRASGAQSYLSARETMRQRFMQVY